MSSSIVPPSGYPEELASYVKLLKIGVPEGNVRKKIIADGFPEDTFDKYLNPETAIARMAESNTNEENNNNNTNNNNNGVEIDKADSFGDVGLNLLDTMDINGNGLLSPNGNEHPIGENWNAEEKAAELLADTPIQISNQQPNSNGQSNHIANKSNEPINFVPAPNQELKLDLLHPILVKKTLLIVNTFIVNTGAFLNQFVATCENKLHKIHTHVERMETTLGILEGKLQSIDWLQNAEQGIAPSLPTTNELGNVEFKDDTEGPSMTSNGMMTTTTSASMISPPVVVPPVSQPAQDPIKSDPELQPWFKMLKVGVPAQAVRNKMALAGVDDSTIDRVLQIHSMS